ncbi:MAG: hypothetical protein R2684_17440 [Pyrinomonadaceae bacterium]
MHHSRREFLRGFGAGLLVLGSSNVIFARGQDPFQMLVIGDSLVSGQGLLEKDRFYNLVRNHLAEEVFKTKRKVSLKNKSHAGARLFLQEDEIKALSDAEIDEDIEYYKEVNFSFPSTTSQVETARREYEAEGVSADNVDMILMSGSLTDINASYVLNGFLNYKPLRRKIEQHCFGGMKRFLETTGKAFPNAKIFVVGYFPMLSSETPTGDMYNTILELYSFPRPTKPFLNNIATKQLFKILQARMKKRSRIWFEESSKALKRAVDGHNQAVGKQMAFFVPSPIPESRSYGTEDTLLWKMGKKGRSEDAMYEVRLSECPKEISKLSDVDQKFDVRICELSGIGHPNPEGSIEYAKAINAVVDEVFESAVN